MRPVLLQPDNFTPPARTPWGGTRIVEHYKRGVQLSRASRADAPAIVGESWEVSVEPDFPSVVEGSEATLASVIAQDPVAWLGQRDADALGGTSLLVKLLDADDNLSVQIHPSDNYEALRSSESGKPESWYVLEARNGGGIYLGFREGVTQEDVRASIASGEDTSELLFFVPLLPGDFFFIGAGTAHAIGRGVTVVEPQRVMPGRNGVTYRYWDWNRTYDVNAQLSPSGTPRPLHLEHALRVTSWNGPRENALLERIRARAGRAPIDESPKLDVLAGPKGAVPCDTLEVERLTGTGQLVLPSAAHLRAMTVIEGNVRFVCKGNDVIVENGRSAVLPAALEPVTLVMNGAHAILSAAH